jgi:hypothetical protein
MYGGDELMHKIKITTKGPVRDTKVELDGVEISEHIMRLEYIVDACNRVPEITLTLVGEIEIEADEVKVIKEGQP